MIPILSLLIVYMLYIVLYIVLYMYIYKIYINNQTCLTTIFLKNINLGFSGKE